VARRGGDAEQRRRLADPQESAVLRRVIHDAAPALARRGFPLVAGDLTRWSRKSVSMRSLSCVSLGRRTPVSQVDKSESLTPTMLARSR